MQINPKTFCSAPWFLLRNDNLGNYQPCCTIDLAASEFHGTKDYQWTMHTPEQWLSSDYLQYLRKNLNDGNRLAECQACWYNEKNQNQSMRIVYNQMMTNNQWSQGSTWITSYFKNKENYLSDLIVGVDLKISNQCNFSCASCTPVDSSSIYARWKKDAKNPMAEHALSKRPTLLSDIKTIFKTKPNHDLLRFAVEKKPKQMKILGGEPLIDFEALDILSQMEVSQKKQTTLQFVTNGSVDLVETNTLLGHFKDIIYTVSVDGIGQTQEWLRRGSNWNQIEQNLIKARANNVNFSIASVVQVLNVNHLDQLIDWCQTHDIVQTFTTLYKPNFLSLDCLPGELKISAIEKYSQRTDRQSIILTNLLKNSNFDKALCAELEKYLHWYDEKCTWQLIMPEWSQWLDQN